MRRWFRGRLWQHRDFTWLWFSQSIDLFGGQVVDLALPTLAILQLHATPAQVGLLVGLEFVGFPTLGLVAGVWADRLPRRPIMIAANVGPLLAYSSVPIAFFFGTLNILQLYAVALVASCFNVFYEVAYQSYLPSLVERRDLVEANQKLEVSHSASHTVGPGISGLIIQWVGPARALVTSALTLIISTIALLLIRRPESRPRTAATDRAFWSELREGVRVVRRQPIIRALTVCDATTALAINMLLAVWLVFAYRQLHLTPAQVGLVLTVGAIGFVPGALTATIIPRWLGLGRALILSALISGLGVLLVAGASLGPPLVILIAAWLLIYTPAPLFDINHISLRQALTDEALQGRVNATVHTAVWSAAPVGAVIGGLLGSSIGVAQTIPIAAAVYLSAPLWLLGPVRALRAHPEPDELKGST